MLVTRHEFRIRADIEVANQSDPGRQRTENEDYFLFVEPQDEEQFRRIGRLILVTDGMGGRRGGEVASRLAADTIREVFLQQEEGSDARDVLIAGFQAAHHAILQLGRQDSSLEGLGTTCCAAIVKHGKMHYGHVGDSRIYLIRDGTAQPLTEDHSLVARLVRQGLISAEDAKHHEQKNVITAALGLDLESMAGDFPDEPLTLAPGDIILLCTDGLHGLVSDSEIALTMQDQSLRDACRELVARANVRGGPDNITLQLLKIVSVEA